MAEISGLVMGSVALASLFSTCIDLFERIQLGRHHVAGYDLACNKVDLLQARFERWGGSCSSRPTPAFDSISAAQRQAVVERSLIGIKHILEEISVLKAKYKLDVELDTVDHRPATSPRRLPSRHSSKAPSRADIRPKVKGWRSLRKRTLWAIHDKQSFDNHIEDLGFLIDNLQKLPGMEATKSPKSRSSHQGSPDASSGDPSSRSRPQSSPQEKANMMKYHKFDRVFDGCQINDNSVGLVGELHDGEQALEQAAKTCFSTNQENRNGSFGVIGDASAMALQQLSLTNDQR